MDPAKLTKKMSLKYPSILYDNNNYYITVGNSIIATIGREEPLMTLAIYVGCYYIFDIEYPSGALLGLTVLQSILFKDHSAPAEILERFETTMTNLNKWR